MEKHKSMAPLERWGIYSEKMPWFWVKGQQVAKSEKKDEWYELCNLYLQPAFLWEFFMDGVWLYFATCLEMRLVSLLLFKQQRHFTLALDTYSEWHLRSEVVFHIKVVCIHWPVLYTTSRILVSYYETWKNGFPLSKLLFLMGSFPFCVRNTPITTKHTMKKNTSHYIGGEIEVQTVWGSTHLQRGRNSQNIYHLFITISTAFFFFKESHQRQEKGFILVCSLRVRSIMMGKAKLWAQL